MEEKAEDNIQEEKEPKNENENKETEETTESKIDNNKIKNENEALDYYSDVKTNDNKEEKAQENAENTKEKEITKEYTTKQSESDINQNLGIEEDNSLTQSLKDILMNKEFAAPVVIEKESKILSDFHYVTFKNAYGENSCFVNVVLHLLYNIPELDEYLISLYQIDEANTDNKDNSNNNDKNQFLVLLGKILYQYEAFIDEQFDDNKKLKNKNSNQIQIIKTLNMRKVLANVSDNLFPLNTIADPVELFTFILDILNENLKEDVHKSFYLELIDEFSCRSKNNCRNNIKNKYDKDNFIYHIYIDEIFNYISKKNLKVKDYKNKLFELSYKLFLSENTKKCEKCKEEMEHNLICANGPQFLLINCVWKESNPIVDDVISLFFLMSLKDELNNLFTYFNKRTRKQNSYYLLGFILYSFTLSHYIICIYNFDKKVFALFDDEVVKEFNNLYELIQEITVNVLKMNDKAFFYPVMLIFTQDNLYDYKDLRANLLNDSDYSLLINKCNEAIYENQMQNNIKEEEKLKNYNDFIEKQKEIENKIHRRIKYNRSYNINENKNKEKEIENNEKEVENNEKEIEKNEKGIENNENEINNNENEMNKNNEKDIKNLDINQKQNNQINNNENEIKNNIKKEKENKIDNKDKNEKGKEINNFKRKDRNYYKNRKTNEENERQQEKNEDKNIECEENKNNNNNIKSGLNNKNKNKITEILKDINKAKGENMKNDLYLGNFRDIDRIYNNRSTIPNINRNTAFIENEQNDLNNEQKETKYSYNYNTRAKNRFSVNPQINEYKEEKHEEKENKGIYNRKIINPTDNTNNYYYTSKYQKRTDNNNYNKQENQKIPLDSNKNKTNVNNINNQYSHKIPLDNTKNKNNDNNIKDTADDLSNRNKRGKNVVHSNIQYRYKYNTTNNDNMNDNKNNTYTYRQNKLRDNKAEINNKTTTNAYEKDYVSNEPKKSSWLTPKKDRYHSTLFQNASNDSHNKNNINEKEKDENNKGKLLTYKSEKKSNLFKSQFYENQTKKVENQNNYDSNINELTEIQKNIRKRYYFRNDKK